LLASLLAMLSYSHYLIGRPQDSLVYAQRCQSLGEADPGLGKAGLGFSAHLFGRLQAALVEAMAGDIQRGLRGTAAAIRAPRETGEIEMLGWAANTVVELAVVAGELGDAPALVREGLAASERIGSAFSQAHSAFHLAWVQIFQGDFENAVASLERALAIV